MHYRSKADVLRMHELALERYGGGIGVRDAGGLDSAVHQPMASFGGEDLYPSIFSKAAALGYSLIRNHPFIDGNKRVGLMAVGLFLEINGQTLLASNEEAYAFTLSIAIGELDREEAARWLETHSGPIS